MHEVSDQVKEFWEKRGYAIMPRFTLQDHKASMLWDAYSVKDNVIYYTICLTASGNEFPTEYYWDGKTYSEQEILKIYKLKAFT